MKDISFLGLITFSACFSLLTNISVAQNVGVGTDQPHPSAKLEVTSTNSGFLPPRMSFAQRNAIINPAAGLIIFCNDCGLRGQAQIFDGLTWTDLVGGVAKGVVDTSVPAVVIGSQVWSSKNLDVTTYRNGDSIPQVTDANQWTNLTTGAWCWYNNDSALYGATYGRLYNWYAVNDPRGLAPPGWHVPTEAEWNRLVKFLDPSADTTCQSCNQSITAGGAMKNTTGWVSPNTGATNSSGFSGFPGGYRYDFGTFNFVGSVGLWWSANQDNSSSAWYRNLLNSEPIISRYKTFKKYGLSVRVIRD